MKFCDFYHGTKVGACSPKALQWVHLTPKLSKKDKITPKSEPN